jgi:hypothetical protein
MTATTQGTFAEDLLRLFRALAIAEIECFYQTAQVIAFNAAFNASEGAR